MSYLDILRQQLRIDEGERLLAYRDSEGYFTIGVGHNLDTKPIRSAASALILDHDIEDAECEARQLVPGFDALTEARKAALVNMAFNLGLQGLAGFKKFLAAVNVGDWPRAAAEMMDSRWAGQVGARAQRLEKAIREG